MTTTVTQYLASLPEDRRRIVKALRAVIRKNLDGKFKESIQSGGLAYTLPHSVYPEGYHCNPKDPLPFAGVLSQKNHVGLYLFCVYCEKDGPQSFAKAWRQAGKKLDMGKSCVRIKKLEDIPLEVVGRAVKRITAKKFVASYEASLPAGVKAKRAKAARAAGPAAGKKPATRKTATRKTAAKKAKSRSAR